MVSFFVTDTDFCPAVFVAVKKKWLTQGTCLVNFGSFNIEEKNDNKKLKI
jgi:hypothetical protein